MFEELAGGLSAAMDDPGTRTAAAAACTSACAYAALCILSRHLSPRLCPAYKSFSRGTQADWDTRFPSTFHALVTLLLGMYALVLADDFTPDPGRPSPVLRTTHTSWTSVGFSFGYFLADTTTMLLTPQLRSTAMIVHHVIALTSLAVAVQVRSMHIYLLTVLLTEVTTPFVNIRYWLDVGDMKHLPVYTYNGVALLLVWGVFRVATVAPFFLHVSANWEHVIQLPWHGLVLLLGVPVLLFVLNTFWWYKIAKGAYKLVFGPARLPPQATAAAPAGANEKTGRGRSTVNVEAYSGIPSPKHRPHVE